MRSKQYLAALFFLSVNLYGTESKSEQRAGASPKLEEIAPVTPDQSSKAVGAQQIVAPLIIHAPERQSTAVQSASVNPAIEGSDVDASSDQNFDTSLPMKYSTQDKASSQNSSGEGGFANGIHRKGGFHSVQVHYLLWAAREDNLGFAVDGINENPAERVDAVAGKERNLPSEWYSGVRLTTDFSLPCQSWDMALEWTWYHNKTRGHAKGAPSPSAEAALYAEWSLPAPNDEVLESNANVIQFAREIWELHYQTLDFAFRRKIGFGTDFAFTPHMGLRGAWIHQDLQVNYEPGETALLTRLSSYKVKTRSDFQGVGVRGGFDLSYYLSSRWSIIGKAAAALIFGEFEVKRVDTIVGAAGPGAVSGNVFSAYHNVNIEDRFHSIKTQFEGSLGLSWESASWKKASLTFDLAYEFQLWSNQNQFFKFTGGGFTQTLGRRFRVGGDIVLHGVVFGSRVCF